MFDRLSSTDRQTLRTRRDRLELLQEANGPSPYPHEVSREKGPGLIRLSLRPKMLPADDLRPNGWPASGRGVSRSQPMLRALSAAIQHGIPIGSLVAPYMSREELNHWHDIMGDDDNAVVGDWARYGFSAERAAMWRAVGLSTPSLAARSDLLSVTPAMHAMAIAIYRGSERPSMKLLKEVRDATVDLMTELGTPNAPQHQTIDQMLLWNGWPGSAVTRFLESGVPIKYANEAWDAGIEDSVNIVHAYKMNMPLAWGAAAFKSGFVPPTS